jgi:DNA-binding MltR family transcriptional regulator
MNHSKDGARSFEPLRRALRGPGHPGIALAAGACLDQGLQNALLARMDKPNRDLRDSLFEGYGPLSSFKAKIDVAFAFGIVDSTIYRKLNAIRKVRNLFAHSPALLTFESSEVLLLLEKLGPMSVSVEPQAFFMEQLTQIDQHLDRQIAAGRGPLGQSPAAP